MGPGILLGPGYVGPGSYSQLLAFGFLDTAAYRFLVFRLLEFWAESQGIGERVGHRGSGLFVCIRTDGGTRPFQK